MASVCGATLGLMAAGVPISNPVAGISVGLVKKDEKWVLLTDIIGNEDHFGDMDFKIAGTQNGITGIQLDLKIDGISEEIIRATLIQSREARVEILRSMLSAISRPRPNTAPTAPRLMRTHIDPEKIGLLIGPGGKTIRAIQERTGVVIEVDDDGTVTIAASDEESAQSGLSQVEALTASVQVGKIYDGRVTSVKDFGAFVEILPGKDGLCHISELSDDYVSSVADICNVGDSMKVKVIAVEMVAEVCSVYVMRAGEVLELFATEGLNKSAVHRTRLMVGEGLVGEIAAHARPLNLSDAQSHPQFAYRPETGEEVYHSLLGAPILRGGRVRGVVDIVVAIRNDMVSVLAGEGGGRFGAERQFPVGQGPEAVAVGDVSGDGLADIVVANGGRFQGGGSSDVSVLIADGAGGFASRQGNGPQEMARIGLEH